MSETKDKYDLAIEYLTEFPSQIPRAWEGTEMHVAGCLFSFVSPSRHSSYKGLHCGCPVMIRGGRYAAFTDNLTEAIKADERLPQDDCDITIAHLPIFAEWQRRIDQELGRV